MKHFQIQAGQEMRNEIWLKCAKTGFLGLAIWLQIWACYGSGFNFKIRPKSPDKQTSIKPAAAFEFHFLFPSHYLKKRISMKRSLSKRTLRFADERPEMAKNAGI